MNRNTLTVLAAFAMSCSGRPLAQPHSEPLASETVVGRAVHDLDLKPLGSRSAVLDEAVERLRPKGVEIVAVSVDESAQDAETFLHARPAWSLTFAHDPGGRSLRRLDVPKMPTSYVIDRSGVVREVHAGSDEVDFRAIESKLIELGAAP